MDSTYLEQLIKEVNARGGGIVLTLGGKSEAVVLNINRYNDLLKQASNTMTTSTISAGTKLKQAILVTGGAGYIGAHTVRQLLAQGYTVVVLDNLSTGRREFVPPDVEFVQGDVGDREILRHIFTHFTIDAVMHFAASLEVEESVAKPGLYLKNNFINTAILAEAMAEHDVRSIIFSSTAAVYGEDQGAVPIPESAALQPNNPYGHSKYLAEKLLKYYSDYLGFRVTVLRYFNASGACLEGDLGDTHMNSHLVPIILEVAQGSREKIIVNGNDYPTFDGTCIRDYIHVLDVADAHILALQKLGVDDAYHVYNVGTGKGSSVEEMICAAAEITNRMVPMEIGPRRAGDAASTVADNAKIKADLGFEPKYSTIETIIKTTWNRLLVVKQQEQETIIENPPA
jgi:UDP-glucose 4-epimerase